MQTEISQPMGKRLMLETRFTKALIRLGLGFLGLHKEPMIHYFSYLLLNKSILFPKIFQFT